MNAIKSFIHPGCVVELVHALEILLLGLRVHDGRRGVHETAARSGPAEDSLVVDDLR